MQAVEGFFLFFSLRKRGDHANPEEALRLASLMRKVWEGLGQGFKMSVTHVNMDQPLGDKIGNALAIDEHQMLLMGLMPGHDLTEAVLRLCASALFDAGISPSVDEGRTLAQSTIDDGSALRKYQEMVEAQGGSLSSLPTAAHQVGITSNVAGYVHLPQCRDLGKLVNDLLAGAFDTPEFDPTAGLILHHRHGAQVKSGDRLITICANDEGRVKSAREWLEREIQIRDEAPAAFERWLSNELED